MNPFAYATYTNFVDCFAARDDAYVWDSSQHVNEPITPQLVMKAQSEGHSVSVYLTKPNEKEAWRSVSGGIDLDEGDADDGRKVRAVLKEQGIPSLLVESRRGFHLWTFFNGSGNHDTVPGGDVPSDVVRRALKAACVLSGLPTHPPKIDPDYREQCKTCSFPVHRHVEVFPKESTRAWGGGALRLPLLPHPKTGIVYPVWSPGDTPIETVRDLTQTVILMASATPWDRVWRLAGGDDYDVAYPTDLGPHRRSLRVVGDIPTVTDLLASRGLTVAPGHSVRCPFHPDGKASLSIAADDERCFCKSPACDLYNDGRGMGSLQLRTYMETAP